ncbi:hypothetical protein KP509_19G036200 [Ceratopteris richardii]|uniref:Uncharacterized protein n=1 Tax=Ceratopteris richardii TaxID=49495 RepID=A0A8T2SLG6_CERRI|nr:hypothetical protein KP509_19G036200 [Ceratopteris richardii]
MSATLVDFPAQCFICKSEAFEHWKKRSELTRRMRFCRSIYR